jgi:hypothetical protein
MFERMNKENKLKHAKDMFQRAISADQKFQSEAKDDFAFRDGNQWTAEERRILEEELRPVLTFNLTKSSVDLVMGMNEDNRIIHRASPVETTDAYLAEVLDDISDWVRETGEFEDEQDSALESATICGRGWVAIDFFPDTDRFGEIKIDMIDVPVYEVHFDPGSRRPNLEDAGALYWDRWLNVEDFKMRYPKVKGKALQDVIDESKKWGIAEGTSPQQVQAAFDIPVSIDTDDSDYNIPMDFNFYNNSKNMIRVVHMEYWETYERFYGFNPETGKFEEFDGKNLKVIKQDYLETYNEEFTYETITDKRVKWLQFTGNRILYDDLSPMPFKGFSLVPMFAFRDVSKRTSNNFGLVRLMKDPQKEINKRWSQALNMLNQQVQPGVYAETEAFVDDTQARMSMKESGSITYVQGGALQSGRIKERTVPTFPNAPMQMEQFSQDIMKKITGINPDLLGQDRGRQEPGVVVRLRQQQGITLLKPLFKSYNRMKKALYKRQLAIIMEYMPDDQIFRILGQGERYEITPEGIIVDKATNMQASIRDVRNLDYNIIAEESPGNMTKRMMELSIYTELMQAGLPVDPKTVIEKLELSATEKARWLQYIEQQMQQQSEQQQTVMQAEMQFKDREIKVDEQKNMLDFVLGMAKINATEEKDKGKLVAEFAALDMQQRQSIAQFLVDMTQVMAQAEQAQIAARS